jgi:hypothetical protein
MTAKPSMSHVAERAKSLKPSQLKMWKGQEPSAKKVPAAKPFQTLVSTVEGKTFHSNGHSCLSENNQESVTKSMDVRVQPNLLRKPQTWVNACV